MPHKIIISNTLPLGETMPFLADEDITYINKFKNKTSKQNSATGRYLLRKDLSLLYPNTFKNIPLSYNIHGKPLINNIDNYYFNISHSHNLVAFVSANNPYSIDIELITQCKLQIAKRFFHKNEYQHLCTINETEQDTAFFLYWTAKEAFVKLTGNGISSGFDNFYISNNKVYDNNDNILASVKSEIITHKKDKYAVTYATHNS